MKNSVYTAVAICFCLAIGKLVHHVLGGLPASLYGMILYCLLLQLTWLNPQRVNLANQWIIKHMGVCFVPPAVGVINHFDLIKTHGFALVSIIVITTFILLTFVGVLAEKHLTHANESSPF